MVLLTSGPKEYPLQLGIAYLLLVGYLVRTLFVSVRLPASVGVILAGFGFSFFIQVDIFYARDVLQELAFFLVLLTAGLEIRLQDLKPYMFVMAWLPATFELLAIAAYAYFVLEYAYVEGLVLGTVLVAIGDGLVIPKMKEFGGRFHGHPMPRLVFTWAPLEASFALMLFGILVGLSAPANQPHINLGVVVFANILRIVATLCAGAAIGAASGWFITRRTNITFRGNQVFTGASVEAFLMILATALIAFGLGAGEAGKELVPMGFSPGSLFQPELLVIVTGTFFSHQADREVLEDVESIMGGVWVFGQLVLFSMLGSRTTLGIFPQIPHVLPIIATTLLFRFLGVFFATGLVIMFSDASDNPFSCKTMLPDVLFCFLSTLPRATIQGALGAVPVTQRFFQHYPQKHAAQSFIFTAARLYIVCMSVCGMILLNFFGPQLLQMTDGRPQWIEVSTDQEVNAHSDSNMDEIDRVSGGDTDLVKSAKEVLADEFSVTPQIVSLALIRAQMSAPADNELIDENSLATFMPLPDRIVSEPTNPTHLSPAQKIHGKQNIQRLLGIHARRELAHRSQDLALAQFDCMGQVFHNEVSVLHHQNSLWRGGSPVPSRPGSFSRSGSPSPAHRQQ